MFSFIAEIDGKNINYELIGEGAHHILILPTQLEITPCDITPRRLNKMFGPLFDTKLFTIIVMNPFGYEFSKYHAKLNDKLVYKSDRDYAVKLMTKLGINCYSIVGSEEGAKIALQIAIKHPAKVSNLIIWNANAFATNTVDKYNASNAKHLNLDVKNIRCETLILHGDLNSLPMMHPTFFLDTIPNAKLYRFPHGSQNIHREFPKMFCDVIAKFLLK